MHRYNQVRLLNWDTWLDLPQGGVWNEGGANQWSGRESKFGVVKVTPLSSKALMYSLLNWTSFPWTTPELTGLN